ncbi:MAG: Glucose-1-phosphate thymidylyltransferase [uncultured Corynebacteriales bacterium]|uniref:Glucose-1-phosphate thymidylyltransferase n=1 Tax=uncultured Mycobacteriales bacterium TaxID=581187 RepID=A0A6J4IHW0_9ACTN|nr:MAG: Glucose-1-phosphate thymidylyltransferase [uncultured Corynebacteriales bacterium]
MKGIILAGGSATRLHPATLGVSQPLLPVYDKPLVYYPLSVLMLAGVRDVLVVSTPAELPRFRALLRDGSHLGLRVTHRAQTRPGGPAEALLVGADHVGDDQVALIQGDNIFHGTGFRGLLRSAVAELDGCTLFGYGVADPRPYAVAEVDGDGRLVSLEERPAAPRSNRAVTGLYLYDPDVVGIASALAARGIPGITDVNRVYLRRGRARVVDLGRGFAWQDTGTEDALLAAAHYVRTLEHRQGLRVACVEEVALHLGLIDAEQCHRLGAAMPDSGYGRYVRAVAAQARQVSGPPWKSTIS